MASLADVTNQLKENNETQEFLLMENAVQLEDIREILSEISNNFARFYADYTEQITASLEAQAEAARQVEDAGGTVPTAETGDEEKITIPILGLITSIAALSKMFDVDEFVRFPATIALLQEKFKPFTKAFDKITDVFTTIRIGILDKFGKFGALFDEFIEGIGKVAGKIGSFLRPLGTLVSKLALPITAIFAVIDGISGFMKEFGETGSIVDGLRGAVEGIFDGLVGGLIRIISSGIEFILESLGFEDAAAGLGNLTDQLTEYLKKATGGIFDAIAGIFTFDIDRIMQGLTNILPEKLQKVLGIGQSAEETKQQEIQERQDRIDALQADVDDGKNFLQSQRDFVKQQEELAKLKEEQAAAMSESGLFNAEQAPAPVPAAEPTAEPAPAPASEPAPPAPAPPPPPPPPPAPEPVAEPQTQFAPAVAEAQKVADEGKRDELLQKMADAQAMGDRDAFQAAYKEFREAGLVREGDLFQGYPKNEILPEPSPEARKVGLERSISGMTDRLGELEAMKQTDRYKRGTDEQKAKFEIRLENQRSAIQDTQSELQSLQTGSAAPAPNPALTAPVGQASKEVAAASSAPTIVAPQTTVAPTTNNSNVTNINNSTTVGSTSARPTEPSFMRVQEQSAAF